MARNELVKAVEGETDVFQGGGPGGGGLKSYSAGYSGLFGGGGTQTTTSQ